jgi:hypothetical protein
VSKDIRPVSLGDHRREHATREQPVNRQAETGYGPKAHPTGCFSRIGCAAFYISRLWVGGGPGAPHPNNPLAPQRLR